MRATAIAVLLLSCAGEPPRSEPVMTVAIEPAVAAAAASAPALPAPAVASAEQVAADRRAAARRAAHDALAEQCGECHEGHRSKVAKALAVFDLDQPEWPARFDEHRFASAAARLAKKSPAAREVFLAFRDAERAGAPVPAVGASAAARGR